MDMADFLSCFFIVIGNVIVNIVDIVISVDNHYQHGYQD